MFLWQIIINALALRGDDRNPQQGDDGRAIVRFQPSEVKISSPLPNPRQEDPIEPFGLEYVKEPGSIDKDGLERMIPVDAPDSQPKNVVKLPPRVPKVRCEKCRRLRQSRRRPAKRQGRNWRMNGRRRPHVVNRDGRKVRIRHIRIRVRPVTRKADIKKDAADKLSKFERELLEDLGILRHNDNDIILG